MINAVQLIARWTHQSGLTARKKMKVAPLYPSLLTARGKMLHQKVTGLKRPPPPQLLPHIPGNHHCRSMPQFLPHHLNHQFPVVPSRTKFLQEEESVREERFGSFQGFLGGIAAHTALINTRRVFHANALNTKCFSSIYGDFMTIMIT